MKRWEMLHAADDFDSRIERSLRDNDNTLRLLDRVFKPEESDLALGGGYVNGEFGSIAAVCIKEILDERCCGRLGHVSLNYAIPLAIQEEYKERGYSELPNGEKIVSRNIRKMLLESD